MLARIDNLLNRITMYRLMLYYLIALWVIAALFGAFGIMPYAPLALIVSAAIILAACWATNTAIAKIFRVPTNVESVYITAFILALIISPIALKPFNVAGFWFLIWASVFAMASKYVLAINRKHIFNPAAFAVALTALVLNQYASWWVGGNLPMLAFVVIGGLLVIRKLQRFDLVLTYFAAALASCVITNLPFSPAAVVERVFIHTTMLFFGFVMLTEPLTTPPTRPLRIIYGALVGALFSPLIHIGSIGSTPELTLLVGNIFAYIVSPKKNFKLKLKSKTPIGADTYDFAFAMDGDNKKMNFRPGQYMEFTLAHQTSDSRGNRRYFTVASSPAEPDLHLGIKFYGNGSSSFKKALLALKLGDTMMGGQLAGDFTLPRNAIDGSSANNKLVFIAGGIGITPFRSMVKFLSDKTRAGGKRPDIVLLYSNRTNDQIPYKEVFDEAARTIGLKTVYVATDEQGRIDAAFIQREIHDWKDRTFYISGTHAMVSDLKKSLHELKVPLNRIKTDFFPGFA